MAHRVHISIIWQATATPDDGAETQQVQMQAAPPAPPTTGNLYAPSARIPA